jgi:ATP-binding cassette subfamily F protein 3
MLLEEPDLLLLDEPTNYLDIRSIEWLQDYLYNFKGAIVMIAHDRYLLDALVQRVWGIEARSVFIFPGNYSNYLSDRERRESQQLQQFEDQQAFIKRTEHFIAKFKGRKDTAPRAMSRQRMLDKLEVIEAPETLPEIRIRFPEAEDVYGKAFEFRGVSRSFGEKHVLSDVNLTIAGGEKVGLFGANGQGKTTMLRMLAGRLEPSKGSVWTSQKSQIAYYEQGAEETLDPNDTVLETVASAGSGFTTNELKGILGMFLFSGDAVDKRVRVLSGGERSRLAIIRVLLMPSNLLILDEPTNHLDIRSREILFEAMKRYQRTVVFSAHDRFMLDQLADKTVRVEGGQAVLFPGNFSHAAHKVVKAAPKPAVQPHRPEPKPAAARQPQHRHRKVQKPDAKPVVTLESLRQRLERVTEQYEQARSRFEFDRARTLAQEQRELREEIEARKADDLAEPGK